MADEGNQLWQEYQVPFKSFDDLTLARWVAQTLGQFEGSLWRLSHPLIGAYRAASEQANERQIWFKRLATYPPSFPISECCRTPLLTVFTREIAKNGLICQHCGGTAIDFADLPAASRTPIKRWAEEYSELHAVAHWEEDQVRSVPDYDAAVENAANRAAELLRVAATDLLPPLLDFFPALIWEDQDECLMVEPKDICTWS